MSQICFSRQELSNEHEITFARQFGMFDIHIGVDDLLGAGGPKLKGEPPSLVNVFLA